MPLRHLKRNIEAQCRLTSRNHLTHRTCAGQGLLIDQVTRHQDDYVSECSGYYFLGVAAGALSAAMAAAIAV